MTNATLISQYNRVLEKYHNVAIQLSATKNQAFIDGRRVLDQKLVDIGNELGMVNTWVTNKEFNKLEVFFDKMRYFAQELDDVTKLLGYKQNQTNVKAA